MNLSFLSHPQVFVRDIDSVQQKIASFSSERLQIVSDFDGTITADNWHTSWSLFSKSGLMPAEYIRQRDMYFAQYHPHEIDATLDASVKAGLMREWWLKHLELFETYKLQKIVLTAITEDSSMIAFRSGMDGFMKASYEKQIPCIVLSAGVANTIEIFLVRYWALFENVHIIGNRLVFNETGTCSGIDRETVIHTENKDEHDMPKKTQELVRGRTDIVLLGDGLWDVKMVNEISRQNALKIGFLWEKKQASREHFREKYDIVIEDNYDSFGIPEKILECIL